MTSNGENGGAVERRLSDSHQRQIQVLKTLSGEAAVQHVVVGNTALAPSSEQRHFNINEIAQISGLQDEKEVQRYLFILEGQKLVAPFPEGDFTSKTWHITRSGVKALKTIEVSDTN